MKNYPIYEQGLHYQDLHEDHKNWILELNFFKEEIVFFSQLLEDYAKQNNALHFNAFVEQFQNKFILHREKIDVYLHDLHKEEKKLSDFIKSHTKNVEFITFSDHKKWREEMAINRKLFAELKKDFFQTLLKR